MRTRSFDLKNYKGLKGLGLKAYAPDPFRQQQQQQQQQQRQQQLQQQRDTSSSSSCVTADGQPIKETPPPPLLPSHHQDQQQHDQQYQQRSSYYQSSTSSVTIEEEEGGSYKRITNAAAATTSATTTTSRARPKRLRFEEGLNQTHQSPAIDETELYTVYWYKKDDYVAFRRHVKEDVEALLGMVAESSPQQQTPEQLEQEQQREDDDNLEDGPPTREEGQQQQRQLSERYMLAMHEVYQHCRNVDHPSVSSTSATNTTSATTTTNNTILLSRPNSDQEEEVNDELIDPTLQSLLSTLSLNDSVEETDANDQSLQQQPPTTQQQAQHQDETDARIIGLEKLALLYHYRHDTDQRRERLQVLVKQIQDNFVWASQADMAHAIAGVCRKISQPHVRFAAVLGRLQAVSTTSGAVAAAVLKEEVDDNE